MSGYNVSLQGNITGFTKVSNAIKQYNALSAISLKEQRAFATAVGSTNSKLGSYLIGLNGSTAGLRGYGVSLVASTAKTIGLTVATTALNAAMTMGISVIVTSLISVFTTWINKSEEIAEKAQESADKINSINESLKTNSETVKNVKHRYAELAQEVENLGKITQNQGTLNNEEYEEFLDLSNQLAGIFPSLTKNYDDNGNAILDLSGDVNTIVGSLDNLIQKEKELTNQQILKEFPSVFKGYTQDLSNAEQKAKNAKTEFDKINNTYQQIATYGTSILGFDTTKGGEPFAVFENEDGKDVVVGINEYIQALNELGIAYKKSDIWKPNQFGGKDLVGTRVEAIGDISVAFTSKLETARENLQYAQQQLEGEKSSINSYLNTWLQNEFSYNQIEDSGLQTAIQDMLFNFDWNSLPDSIAKQFDRGNWTVVSEYLRRNILFEINKVQDDPTISKAISEVFSNTELTPNEKANYLQQIQKYFGEDSSIAISLNPHIEDTETLQKQYDKAIEETMTKFDSYDPTAFFKENSINTQEEIDKWLEIVQAVNSAAEAEKKYLEGNSTPNKTLLSLDENERKALDEYTSKLELFTKLREEWANASSVDRMNLMSSISEQFSKYDLTGLIDGTKTLNTVLSELGQEAISQAKKNIQGFDSEIDSMFATLFDKTEELNRSLADVETLEKALAKVQSGQAFDYEGADGILELVSNFEELADAVLVTADGYSIEKDALIDLLNDSKTYTNELIALQYEYTKAYIEGYETRKAAILDEYNTKWGLLQSDIEDLYDEYQTKPLNEWDLIDKGYTMSDAEMIMRALSELTANEGNLSAMEGKLKEFEEKYKEFTNSINESNKDFSDKINLIDRVIADTEHAISQLETELDKAPSLDEKLRISKDVINENKDYLEKLQEIEKFYQDKAKENFAKIPEEYQQAIKDGVLKIETITNEQHYDAIQEYFDTIDSMYDIADKITSVQSNVKDTITQRLNDIVSEYDSITSLTDAYKDLAQSLLDFQEITVGIKESDYTELIKRELELKSQLEQQFNKLDEEFTINKGSFSESEIREREAELVSLRAEIENCSVTLEEYKDSILELRWDTFEEGIKVLTDLDDELNDLLSLIEDTSNFKDGNITESGLTKLGLYAQQYVNAKKQVAEYGNAIEELEIMYRNGLYSVDEYNEKLSELNASQRESALAMNDAKKAFIDFREEALDAEIEKMRENADAIKSALDAERERQSYLDSISDKQNYIKTLQRQIATLALSDDRKDMAKRLELEQKLVEAQKELAEEERQHSIDVQKEALDKQIEDAEKAKETEIEDLRNNLDSQEALIQEYLSTVQNNYNTVYDNIQQISDEFGITFTDSLISPWESATNAAQLYADYVGQIMSQLDINTGVIDGVSSSSWIQRDNGKWQYKNSDGNYVKNDWVNDFGNRWYSFDNEGFMHENEWIDGNDGSKYYVGHNGAMCTGWNEIDGNHYYFDESNGKLMKDGYTPDGYVVDDNGVWDGAPQMPIEELKKNYQLAHYAKGTLGVKKNQFAIVDENGEELILRTNKQGRPVFLENTDGVLPHQLTKNIFEMAQNYNPMQNLNLPNLSNYKFPEITRKSEPIVFKVNSPLVHVEGGLDSNMMGRLENLMERRVPTIVENSVTNVLKKRGQR